MRDPIPDARYLLFSGRAAAIGSRALSGAYECTARIFDTAAWLVYPSRAYIPLKLRAFIDCLRAEVTGYAYRFRLFDTSSGWWTRGRGFMRSMGIQR